MAASQELRDQIDELADQHATEQFNNGGDESGHDLLKIEASILALPNGQQILDIIREASDVWVPYAEEAAWYDGEITNLQMARVDKIIEKAYAL